MTTAPAADAAARATRRERVRHLADQGKSARAIAAELGVGKDTVRRDLEALRQEAPADAPPKAPIRELVALRNERAFATVAQLRAVVEQVDAERIPFLVLRDVEARHLDAELRQHAATLARIINELHVWRPALKESAADPPLRG
ncbi:helix-turn-helix domain-containing protein [Streptomyces vilmorinianum]|uniref:helix-turn-helix domain-containing protein n=1 Tax=Streptomyces vilmorinianum TaxID=3051092 RepID=UPI0010FB3420|nr:helix-turn-helix domain-containing protein [Streptomyces vilmorinianum]